MLNTVNLSDGYHQMLGMGMIRFFVFTIAWGAFFWAVPGYGESSGAIGKALSEQRDQLTQEVERVHGLIREDLLELAQDCESDLMCQGGENVVFWEDFIRDIKREDDLRIQSLALDSMERLKEIQIILDSLATETNADFVRKYSNSELVMTGLTKSLRQDLKNTISILLGLRRSLNALPPADCEYDFMIKCEYEWAEDFSQLIEEIINATTVAYRRVDGIVGRPVLK